MQISLIYSFICSFLCICYNINLYIFTNHKAFSVKADAFHVRYFIDFSDKQLLQSSSSPQETCLTRVKADIRNPLRYLLITEQLLRSLSGVACTTPDTSKSLPTAYCSAQLKQGTCLTRLKKQPPEFLSSDCCTLMNYFYPRSYPKNA